MASIDGWQFYNYICNYMYRWLNDTLHLNCYCNSKCTSSFISYQVRLEKAIIN
jgi:hypothetical protein